ncbi:hypothetical protein FALCPG4_017577 [Fusarium falciforme]
MNNEPIVRFYDWVERNKKTGLDGDKQERPYVPPFLLKGYWKAGAAVQEILKCCNLQENALQITTQFVRIFSTLVYIGQPWDISLFLRQKRDDHHLPFKVLPDEWNSILPRFLESQWMFCPLEFNKEDLPYKRELNTRQILPVTYLGSLRGKAWGGEGPSIEKVQIHNECNGVTQENAPVVFKIFEGPDMKRLYRAEADVYSALEAKVQKHITQHYGSFSFEETHTRVIILEYAAMGSLLNFFEEVPPPTSPSEYEMLWCELLKLMGALRAFQDMDRQAVEGGLNNVFTTAIHQDIQPANILVFPHPPKSPRRKKSRFDVRFKLADFGLAEVRRLLKPDGHFQITNEGNAMYSAPECYANYPTQSVVRPTVTNTVDVWALGAVYSDVLVWSIDGPPGRDRYWECRREAIEPLGHIKARGMEACFHDGEDVLDAVKAFHAEVLERKRGNDCMSEEMSKFILNDMLRDESTRVTLNPLVGRARQAFNLGRSSIDSSQSPRSPMYDPGHMSAASEDTTVFMDHHLPRQPLHPRPTTPTRQPPPTSEEAAARPATHEPGPGQAPVDEIYEKLVNKKTRSLSLGRALDKIQGKHEISLDLPEMEKAWSLIKARGGRDQIILIDNFYSMRQYQDLVAKTARVISYVTKVADDNGMDLFFASDPTKSQKHTTSKTVEQAIKRMKIVKGKCHMKNCLLNIMKAVFKGDQNTIKPTSIYVYTDAVWEDANEVASVIKTAIGRLAEVKEDNSTLMFQFIQFGNDEQGTEYLRKLDDECKETHGTVEYDIVDTKRWYAKVPSIVIGSISRENDNEDSTAPGRSQPHNPT